MQVSDLLRVLDESAPFSLAEPWDNCGLLIGDGTSAADRILVSLELTDAVLKEAVDGGFDTVLTHHPVLFSPVKRLVEGDPRQKLIMETVRSDINVVSCHTNLDAAPGGLADIVADALSLQDVTPLAMAGAGWYKFVGFVPPDSLPAVSAAVFAAGAGVIGGYGDCAYATIGEGWFTPGEDTDPTVGARGRPERVQEARWETVVPRSRLDAVIRAFVGAHPYEEPAFDVYPVEDRVPRAGLGRVGKLSESMSVGGLVGRLVDIFALSAWSVGGCEQREASWVAVLPGSGRSFLEEAARRADVFVTGDLSYHDAEAARDQGLAVVSLPHGELEWGAMRRWIEGIRDRLEADGVSMTASQCWGSPWRSGAREV